MIEYKVIALDETAEKEQEILNKLGKDNWELVSVVGGDERAFAYLKRKNKANAKNKESKKKGKAYEEYLKEVKEGKVSEENPLKKYAVEKSDKYS
ncbi:MAG: DUF4177 domain-containing protein [Firmicutes bacterium]|nr:DUF4177 domain-containing protein [Bacillota bacterium]